MYIKYLLTFFLLVKSGFCDIENKQCATKTSYGLSEGKLMTSSSGLIFCAFFGVPYAAAPVGSLRFLPPVSPQKWDGIRLFQHERPSCLQIHPGGAEDCLLLNIFTHSTNTNNLSTVMVFIHGGAFHMGSMSTRMLGPEILMDKDIVLVTLQYRLGPFGFLSTGDKVIPGNLGLKDQVKALEWIQENIKFFGGDPGKVTIFGNSAGASSVHLHMQSPKSEKLFVRAISQSGTALSSYAMTTKGKARQDMENLAAGLNCSTIDSLDTLTCLQSKRAENILEVFKAQMFVSEHGYQKLFQPVIEVETENAFITKSPYETITKKPWLVGVTANEGVIILRKRFLDKFLHLIRTDFKNFGPSAMFITDLYNNLEEIANSTYEFYFKNATNNDELMRPFEQIVSDSWFVWPTEQAIRKHNGTLYYYLYDHVGEHSFTEMMNCVSGLGVGHMDELLTLFTQKPRFGDLNPRDKAVSELMVDLWVNFAKEGNPTPRPVSSAINSNSVEDFVWEQANNTNPQYIHIQTDKLSMQTLLFKERMNFWQQLNLDFKS